MIKRCFGTYALELFRANFNLINADIIVKIGNRVVCHLLLAFGLANADIVRMNVHSFDHRIVIRIDPDWGN